MIASVVAAFFACGRLNAGTPSVIASTPVSAVAPCEKAFRIAKTPTAPAVVAAPSIGSTWIGTAGHPPRHCTRPTPISSRIDTTKP